MLRFSLVDDLGKKSSFKVKELDDMTLGEFQEFNSIRKDIDKELLIRLDKEDLSGVTVSDIIIAYPEYIKTIIEFWSNINDSGKLDFMVMAQVYLMIEGVFGYEAKEITSFKFKGKEYYLPESFESIIGKEVAGKASLDEMAQLMTVKKLEQDSLNGELSKLHEQIAYLCREEGVELDDINYKDADKFKELPLEIAFDVSFFLVSGMSKYLNSIFSEVAENLSSINSGGITAITQQQKAILQSLSK